LVMLNQHKMMVAVHFVDYKLALSNNQQASDL
jgi:hypothetical protein